MIEVAQGSAQGSAQGGGFLYAAAEENDLRTEVCRLFPDVKPEDISVKWCDKGTWVKATFPGDEQGGSKRKLSYNTETYRYCYRQGRSEAMSSEPYEAVRKVVEKTEGAVRAKAEAEVLRHSFDEYLIRDENGYTPYRYQLRIPLFDGRLELVAVMGYWERVMGEVDRNTSISFTLSAVGSQQVWAAHKEKFRRFEASLKKVEDEIEEKGIADAFRVTIGIKHLDHRYAWEKWSTLKAEVERLQSKNFDGYVADGHVDLIRSGPYNERVTYNNIDTSLGANNIRVKQWLSNL